MNFLKNKGIRNILYGLCVFIFIIVIFVLFFNRAPERIIPTDNVITSPASGKIIGIIPVDSPNITFTKKGTENTIEIPELSGGMNMVLIEMNPLDVHVQRSPIAGSIISMDYYDGKHINAIGSQKMNIVNTNEKTVTVFKNETDTIGVVQVAGKAARRIRNYAGVNEFLNKGQIYGRILLGSQVVVLVPENRTVNVTVGEKVIDGETILAK
jgi:phosphatidylserine decarboxylase